MPKRFIHLRSAIIAFAALGLLAAPSAYAAPPVKEGCLGRISTVPTCNARSGFIGPFRKPNQRYSIGKKPDARASLAPVAVIQSQSFHQLPGKLGEWSGIVAGNGVVHLALQITENGMVTSTRYIGNVTLSNISTSTSFHFRSSVPTSPNWNWKIIAFKGRAA